MVNKKGWIRIVEATLAALLVLGALVVILNRSPTVSTVDYSRVSYPILDEIAQNSSLREKIIEYDLTTRTPTSTIDELKSFVDSKLNGRAKYEIKICAANELCALDNYKGEVYASERIISSSLSEETFSPKKIKLFIFTGL